MLIRIVKMTFQEDKVDDFLQLFERSENNIRNFPGCLHLELLRGYHQENLLTTLSHWQDEQALENYRHSELFLNVWSETKLLFSAKPEAFSLKQFPAV